jgi:hypothetical protein
MRRKSQKRRWMTVMTTKMETLLLIQPMEILLLQGVQDREIRGRGKTENDARQKKKAKGESKAGLGSLVKLIETLRGDIDDLKKIMEFVPTTDINNNAAEINSVPEVTENNDGEKKEAIKCCRRRRRKTNDRVYFAG